MTESNTLLEFSPIQSNLSWRLWHLSNPNLLWSIGETHDTSNVSYMVGVDNFLKWAPELETWELSDNLGGFAGISLWEFLEEATDAT